MSKQQITTGVRSVLSHPFFYDFFQNLMGANKGRSRFAHAYIRARVSDKILDVGCGTADILLHLPIGISYWGYDISAVYIDAARKRYSNRGQFVCGYLDMDELERLPEFDIVLACGLIHHLNDEHVNKVLSLTHSALKPGGRLVTIDPCTASDQNIIARFLVNHDRGQHVRDGKEYQRLAESVYKIVSGTLRHQKWIPYTHWIMECIK